MVGEKVIRMKQMLTGCEWKLLYRLFTWIVVRERMEMHPVTIFQSSP
jgi:hypothetical protein